MKIIFKSRGHHYLAKLGILLVTVALIAGMVGCDDEYTLTIASTAGGSVTTPGEGAFTYDEVRVVDLSAEAEEGYDFVNWTGDVDTIGNVNAAITTITMDDNYSITANFEAIDHEIFSDDFSDPSSGWVTYDGDEGQVAYLNGYLYIKDYTAYYGTIYAEYAGPQHDFTDFILEVETWLVGGTDDNWHSVICRYQDEDNHYDFDISADGYYEIQKWVDGDVTNLVEPTYSSYIHQGQGVTNSVHIECIGSDLSLSVNGHLLWEGTDATFTGGDIALAANALAGTFTEVAFDNIIVTEPWLLFSDDFSDESSGWVTYDDYDGQVIYSNGHFYIKDYTYPGEAMYGESQRYFTNFVLEVETWLIGGTDDNWHLVICRLQDDDNYYDFGISADGYYAIIKWIGGDQVPLTGSTPIYSTYINQGVGAVNLIHIECIGNSLSLSVNGHLLEEVTDTTFTGGDIALAANALAGTFTEVAFDNIIVTTP
jgi:uncharacterized repeat protein (TIGR02543 family)